MRTGQVTAGPSREAAYGVALSQEVMIADRPVTQQGMSGMKTSAGGVGRQVQDGSFFIGVLRSKINDILAEISRLRAEIERHEKDLSHHGALERTYETLLHEVKSLEGTLADYNLAMDKARTTADPSEVSKYLHDLEDHNRREARALDEVFLVKQHQEKETQELEAQIEAVHRQVQDETPERENLMEGKIITLEPEKLEDYRGLLQRNNELQSEVASKQAEVDELTSQISEHESRSQGDGAAARREEYQRLEKAVGALRRNKKNLQEDLEISSMDPKQARQKLLSKVKADQERLKKVETRMAETKDSIESMKQRLADLDSDLNGGSPGEVAGNKLEVLQKRDQEMTEFIEKFDRAKEDTLANQKVTRMTIVALLEHISGGLESEHHAPGLEGSKEAEKDSSFKDKQLRSSEMTTRRLKQDKEKRQQEMEKITTLEEKIPVELENLKGKIEKMRHEVREFEDVEGLRDRAARTKEHLVGLNTQYRRRIEAMRGQVQQLTVKLEACKGELAASETNKTLEALERKMRTYETNIFFLKEFVETKGREIDFQSVRSECMAMVKDLNESLKLRGESDGFGAAF